jgi:tRNA-specific adenosine deaminase 2
MYNIAAISRVGIKKVYFGCPNDRFGGNGSILSIHTLNTKGYTPYEVQGGLLADEAVQIFQKFYTGDNKRAPEGKKKRKNTRNDE